MPLAELHPQPQGWLLFKPETDLVRGNSIGRVAEGKRLHEEFPASVLGTHLIPTILYCEEASIFSTSKEGSEERLT